MFDKTARILAHTQLAPALYKLVLAVEHVPEQVRPGQFVQLQLGEHSEFVTRRPLSVYAVSDEAYAGTSCLVLVYQVVGKGTDYLTRCTVGTSLKVLGPIGRGWQPPQKCERALLVGGGVGAAPLALLAGDLLAQGTEVHLLLGARSAEALAPFAEQPIQRSATRAAQKLSEATAPLEYYATDDGSRGHHGFNLELMPDLLSRFSFDYIATCGPEPLQKGVAHLAAEHGIPCEVSLERRMACGIGACLSCVVNTTTGKQRACVDGPVFNAAEVCW